MPLRPSRIPGMSVRTEDGTELPIAPAHPTLDRVDSVWSYSWPGIDAQVVITGTAGRDLDPLPFDGVTCWHYGWPPFPARLAGLVLVPAGVESVTAEHLEAFDSGWSARSRKLAS